MLHSGRSSADSQSPALELALESITQDRELGRENAEPKQVRKGYSLLAAALVSLGMWAAIIFLGAAVARWISG